MASLTKATHPESHSKKGTKDVERMQKGFKRDVETPMIFTGHLYTGEKDPSQERKRKSHLYAGRPNLYTGQISSTAMSSRNSHTHHTTNTQQSQREIAI